MDLSHMSHRARRAFLKKLKRKRQRQKLAKENEQKEIEELNRLQLSPSYQAQQAKELELAELEAKERERNEQIWQEREREAQRKWEENNRQKMILKLREEEQKIKAEWESKQTESGKATEESKPQEICEESADLPPWHLPPPPVSIPSTIQQAPSIAPTVTEKCSFFRKTGACRYGFLCSRLHQYPTPYDDVGSCSLADDQDGSGTFDEAIDNSCIVLRIPKMFTHYHLDLTKSVSEDQDSGLEVDESQLLSDYHEFYHDVRMELESRWGKIAAIRTCRNLADHLRGAVYVEFARGPSAAWDAAEACNGRWFAGRQLMCTVVRLGGGWREAICGLYHRGKCPKGDLHCNFLHVFLNPGEKSRDFQKTLWRHFGPMDNNGLSDRVYSSTKTSHSHHSSSTTYHHHYDRRKKRRHSSSSRSSLSPSPKRIHHLSHSNGSDYEDSSPSEHHRHRKSKRNRHSSRSSSTKRRRYLNGSPASSVHNQHKKHVKRKSHKRSKKK